MTFLAPAQSADARFIAALFGRRAARPRGRTFVPGEDGARSALGSDHALPPSVLHGTSIEHLARIAFG